LLLFFLILFLITVIITIIASTCNSPVTPAELKVEKR
jgi:hypothetical protein